MFVPAPAIRANAACRPIVYSDLSGEIEANAGRSSPPLTWQPGLPRALRKLKTFAIVPPG